jgi:hypothetical protein
MDKEAPMEQGHERVEQMLNERESIIWDTTDIRPEVKEVFTAARKRRVRADRAILAKLGLGRKAHKRSSKVTDADRASALTFD